MMSEVGATQGLCPFGPSHDLARVALWTRTCDAIPRKLVFPLNGEL